MKTILITLTLALSLSVFAGAKKQNILEVAKENGNFKTLVTALEATGLDKAIAQTKNLTVFAPNDDAFAKLPAGTIEALLNDVEALSKILFYHVAPKKLKAKKVLKLNEIKTLQGQTILTNLNEEGAFLNESKIIATDIKAKNGIVHVIDSVLLPDASKPSNTFETEQSVDIQRYMGLWYEYARYENEFQENCLGTTAKYTLKKTVIAKRPYVLVQNRCQKENGNVQGGDARAFVVNKETNAELKVSFVPVLKVFGLFGGDYNILKVGNNYEYALVGDKKRSNFWILTREKEISDSLYRELLDIAEDKGFRKELIKKSPVWVDNK